MLADWRKRAACRDADPTLFDCEGRGTVAREALRVCVGCPVRAECLDEALEYGNRWWGDWGIWGGTTAGARRQVRHGTLTPFEAMAAGDRLAAGRTDVERLADEPWLAAVAASPVEVRPHERARA